MVIGSRQASGPRSCRVQEILDFLVREINGSKSPSTPHASEAELFGTRELDAIGPHTGVGIVWLTISGVGDYPNAPSSAIASVNPIPHHLHLLMFGYVQTWSLPVGADLAPSGKDSSNSSVWR